jgi:glycosyltransferase involved in cell wall biosynthesis
MRIAVLHNFYQQPGGEDQVFASETELLERAGHTVIRITETNDRLNAMGSIDQARAMIWNQGAYRRVFEIVQRERVEVAHFHNTFILLSPASYYAARRAGAAVVQTLHNYRLLCPSATFLRDGKPCEDCLGHLVAWPGVQHACYHGSRKTTAGIAAMLSLHRAAGTWRNAVDAYIALSEFARPRFVKGGLPASRIFVKPNFIPDPGMGRAGDYVLFAGRICHEKGIATLLEAWRSGPGMPPLRIAGDGPMAAEMREQIRELKNVEWIGRLSRDQVLGEMRGAMALVMPSIWYEGFPVSVAEAYATGLPVIASNIGALPEVVKHERTGLVFEPGNAREFSDAVRRLARDSDMQSRLRSNCRAEFLELYGEERNLQLLMQIYETAIKRNGHNHRLLRH